MVSVANTNAEAMSGLATLLPQAPAAVQQQFISLVAARLEQHAQDISGNAVTTADEIARVEALIPAISDNLTPEQVQQVIDAVPDIPDLVIITHPNGSVLDNNSTLDLLVKLAHERVVAILEAQRGADGHVTQATLELSDGSTKVITFTRSEDGTTAIYDGQMADGQGGLANAYQFKLEIARLQNASLGLDMSYDSSDIKEMRTYVTGFSYEFRALNTSGARRIPDEEYDNYAPVGGLVSILNGATIAEAGFYHLRMRYTATESNVPVELVVNGEVLFSYASPALDKVIGVYVELPAGSTFEWSGDVVVSETYIQTLMIAPTQPEETPDSL